jgi:hypothetical protein
MRILKRFRRREKRKHAAGRDGARPKPVRLADLDGGSKPPSREPENSSVERV